MLGVRYADCVDIVTLTRRLIDIESITGNEAEVGEFLFSHLRSLGWQVEKQLRSEERRVGKECRL